MSVRSLASSHLPTRLRVRLWGGEQPVEASTSEIQGSLRKHHLGGREEGREWVKGCVESGLGNPGAGSGEVQPAWSWEGWPEMRALQGG